MRMLVQIDLIRMMGMMMRYEICSYKVHDDDSLPLLNYDIELPSVHPIRPHLLDLMRP